MNYLLAVWLCLPSFLMVVFSLPSLAIGLIFTSLAAMLSTLLLNLKRRVQFSKPYLLILIAAVISIFVSHYAVQQPFTQKQGLGIVGLAVLAFTAPTVFHYYFSRQADRVSRELKWMYLIFFVIGMVGIVSPIRVGPFLPLNHPVFPFSEPSHFTLAYAQIASFALVFMRKRGRMLVVALSFLLALSLPNVTMLAVAFLLLLITVSVRIFLFLVLALAASMSYVLSLYPESLVYFTDRLVSGDAENLSRLVYVQGWESLILANLSTNWVGVGFQNLGNEPPGAATEIIRILTNEIDLNRLDGGFLFAKIGGEFGVVGVVVGGGLLILAILSGIKVRRKLKSELNTGDAALTIPLCSSYIFVVELMVRGVGYFSPTLILTLYFIPKAIGILRNKVPGKAAVHKVGRSVVN